MNGYENQKKEIATIKGRTIELNLSDADCERISELCGKHGLTVGNLLENFIGDLVNGTYTNGSDERMYANQWFDRCWFGASPEYTLLKHLLEWGFDIEEFLGLVDEIKSGKEDLEDFEINPEKWDKEEIEYLKEDIEGWREEYNYYIYEYIKKCPDANLEKEINGCYEWLKKYKNLLGED